MQIRKIAVGQVNGVGLHIAFGEFNVRAANQVTDRLRSLYLSEWSLARWLRNDGVRMVNRLPLAKSVLVDYATR